MATSASCNSIGGAIDKLGKRVHQQASKAGAEGNLYVGLLNADRKEGIKGTDDHGPLMPNNINQASRFASIAVAATACAGLSAALSMCPVEALAVAYEGDHRNVSESVFSTSTSMLQLSGYVKVPRDFNIMGEFYEEEGNAEMEATTGNVPSIKPPNEGLNSPWVPKINGLKTKDDNRRASMRCPKWTESELEMVLPDFQGRPKPFPRMQGHLYPFWPATTLTNNKGDDSNYQDLIQDKFKESSNDLLFVNKPPSSTPNGDAHDTHKRSTLPSSPAPPPQQFHMPIKKPSCFTM